MKETDTSVKPGVFRGWWIVLIAASGQGLSIGTMFMYTFGIFSKPLASEFRANRASISLAILLLNLMVTLTAPFMGCAVDRFGGRRVITTSIVMLSCLLFILSTVTTPLWHLYGLYALAGVIGAGSSPVAYSRVVANWFDRSRGLALGLASAGIGVGALVMPSLTQLFIQEFGWRHAYAALGCLSLVIAAPVVGIFLRGTPEEVGLFPDGAEEIRDSGLLGKPISGLTVAEALRTRTFWQLCLIFFAVSACANGTITHLAPLLTDRGVPGRNAAFAVSLFGAATIAGRVGNGYLVDRFFAPRVAAFLFGGAAVGVGLLWNGVTGGVALVAAMLLGLAIGAEADVMPFLISRYFGMRSMGALLGFVFGAYTLGAGGGPYLFGAGFDATGSYRAPLGYAFLILLAAIGGMLGLGKYRRSGGGNTVHMKRTISSLAIFLCVGASLYGQRSNSSDPLLHWMDKIAQKQLDAREAAIAGIRTVADAEARKQVVRQKIMEMMGGLPDYSGPLHARVTGSIQADGYVIEKIIYESLPGYFVTANLYRPSQPGRYPGLLLQSGHTQEGKAEPQLLAANLALKGFISLAFDPVGQGEREQTYDPQLKEPAAGWSVNEHIHAEAQSNLAGEGVARYFIWDAKRSIDYLVSRPDVDSTRIGAAGCSGGGALTTFIGALDPRLKVVIPACFPSSYRLLFTGSFPGSEMGIPGLLAEGVDTADFVELSAPTPWLIQATEQDYFTPAGVRLVYDEAKRWYGLYGAEDKVDMFVGPGPHGTPLVSREAVYRWMIRWLKDGHGDFHEQPVKLYSNYELLVTRTGRVEDEPGSRKLHQLILDDYLAKKNRGTIPELVDKLRSLKIPTDGSAPLVKILNESNGTGLRSLQIEFESEPGIVVTGKLYLPISPGRKPAVLLVAGTLSHWLAERTAKSGRVVLELEPRRSFSQDGRRPYVGDYLANERATQIGRNLPAMRAHDILRGVDVLAARDDVDPSSIRAAAQGVKGIWLLLAAASDARISKVWLDRTPYSLLEALHNTLNTDLSDAVIPGFALRWDLDDLVKAMGKRPVLWTDPANWMGHVGATGDSRFRYRYVLGDLTDMSNLQNEEYAREFLQ